MPGGGAGSGPPPSPVPRSTCRNLRPRPRSPCLQLHRLRLLRNNYLLCAGPGHLHSRRASVDCGRGLPLGPVLFLAAFATSRVTTNSDFHLPASAKPWGPAGCELPSVRPWQFPGLLLAPGDWRAHLQAVPALPSDRGSRSLSCRACGFSVTLSLDQEHRDLPRESVLLSSRGGYLSLTRRLSRLERGPGMSVEWRLNSGSDGAQTGD